MIVSEPIEETGFFWLPENPDRRLAGFLRISGSGKVTLEVTTLLDAPIGTGSFGNPWLGEDSIELARIVGITKLGPVTLDNCSVIAANTHFSSELSTSVFSANWAFIGVGYGVNKAVAFSEIRFSVLGFDEWLRISGPKIRHLGDDDISLSLSSPKLATLRISDEVCMEFNFDSSIQTDFNVNEAKITQRAFISLTFKKDIPLSDLLSFAYKIRNFFSFVFTRTTFIDSIFGYSDEMTQPGQSCDYRVPIKVYFEDFPIADERHGSKHRYMLFAFSEIAEHVEDIFAKWLLIYDSHDSVLNRYFLSGLDYSMDLERRFLVLVEGIAAIHRELHGMELHLSERLKEMIKPFQKHFGTDGKVAGFLERTVDARNYLVHLRKRDGDFVPDTNELFELNSKLETLFQLFLLDSLGIGDAHLNSIAERKLHLGRNLE